MQIWLLERFEDIKPWEPFVVDNEWLVWVRCHGIPPHTWGEGICKLMANTMGSYVDIDEDTRLKRSLDIARILIITRGFGVINRVFHITINGSVFPIKMMEEWCCPLRIQPLSRVYHPSTDSDEQCSDSEFSDDSNSEFDQIPPLFLPEKTPELGYSEEEEEEEEGETPANNDDVAVLHEEELGNSEALNENAAVVRGTRELVQVPMGANDDVGHESENAVLMCINSSQVNLNEKVEGSGVSHSKLGVEGEVLNYNGLNIGPGETLQVEVNYSMSKHYPLF